MYIKEIKDMISLMNENDLSEVEVEKDGLRIKLKKSSGGGFDKAVEHTMVQYPGSQQENQPKAPAKPEATNTLEVKSPMVGTFYRAPSPEAASYVNVGDVISPGQVICIIEAMKLMNEIKSEVRGKVIAIQVDNAEPVEFGQPLFVVEPS